MFIIHWVFDKLGYMPKIDMQVGVVKNAWPFPAAKEAREKRIEEMLAEDRPKKKPVAKRTATVAKKTTKKPAKKA
jgi:hypothetical protein